MTIPEQIDFIQQKKAGSTYAESLAYDAVIKSLRELGQSMDCKIRR